MLVSLLMLGLAVLGARIAFALPRDLRSNWIFRLTPLPGGTPVLAARRRALAVASVLPVLIASAALFLTIWPWPPAIGHLIVLALVGLLLVEVSLQHGIQKLPFTCAYLPGRSTVHATLWLVLLIVMPLTMKGATWELQSLADAGSFATMLAILGGLYAIARGWSAWRARSEEGTPQFEEDPPGGMVALNVWDNASLIQADPLRAQIGPHHGRRTP